MDEFATIPAANTTYIRLQNYTNMVVDEHGIQTFEFLIVVLLLLMFFSPTRTHPLLYT